MRLNRWFGAVAAFAVCAAIEAATPEYAAFVQQPYVAQGPLQSIALAPFACPRELDCDEIEKELVAQLAERTGLRIIEPRVVRDLMARASVTTLDDHEGRLIIGEGLGASAFAFVKIQKAQIDVVAPPEQDKWRQVKKEATVKRAELELRVVTRDGAPLMQVSGEAQLFDSIRGLPSITMRLFAVMLERAWS